MFILKLSLELAVLAILFLFIRRSLKKLFPSTTDTETKVSPLSRRVQAFLLILVGLISSGVMYWMFYSAFYFAHNLTSSHGALVVSQASLIVPSLIFGFYISTMLNLSICELLGIDVEAQAEEAGQQSGRSRVLRYVFSTLSLGPAILLLAMQANVYIKVDDGKIYQKDMAGHQRIFNVNEIKKISVDDARYVNIHFKGGDVVQTRGYSGNINYFLDNISR